MRRFASFGLLVIGLAGGCGDNKGVPDSAPRLDGPRAIDSAIIDTAPTPDANPLEPATLFGTGLCVDEACTQITPGILQYEPQYTLFVDGAAKKRWISIPAGAQIDTSDPNHWVFPVGTKVWKEFDVDGVRVETRYIVKILDSEAIAPDPWFYVTYQWDSVKGGDEQGSNTVAVTAGVDNANGTAHRIPSRNQCKLCHENLLPGRVLGFGAASLDFAAGSGLLDLDGAIAADLLSVAPPGKQSPHYPLPADATDADKAAMGYVHANCGHCHNDQSPLQGQTPINLRIDVTKLGTFADTTLATSTIGVKGEAQTAAMGDVPAANCAAIAAPAGQAGCTQLVVADWVKLTAYAIGDRVVKGGNAYLCSVAGTSGALGPSGTGATILDGTATWEFVGTPLTQSILVYRFETNNVAKNMPESGDNLTVDGSGDTILTTWIDQLP